jgi:4-hydroxy-tetrahydrodipicolinate reductase
VTIRVAIHGIAGRMGRAVARLLHDDETVTLANGIERTGGPYDGADFGAVMSGVPSGVRIVSLLDEGLAAADVVIDFTTPDATARLLDACAEERVPAVIGTTGLDENALAALAAAATVVPVVVAPNMSVGVHVLFEIAARAATLLGSTFDAEIVEMHHRHKEDSPSGTALRLAEVVARAKGLDAQRSLVHGRGGRVGARPADQIGVLALRGGDVVGEHTLVFAGAGERIEITHRAASREIFARGALRAAKWVVGKPPGRYDMGDVLGPTVTGR